MNRRSAIALFALAAFAAGCHRAESHDERPVTPAGKAVAGKADPWNTTAKKDPLAHPLLWSIEKDGHTSYALGTMHIGVDPDTRLPDLAWQKLAASPQFAMETDLSDHSLAEEMTKRPAGTTLHDELGATYWKKLEEAVTPTKARMMDSMPATVPMTMLSMRALPMTAPMDGVLFDRAKAQHKMIVFLEPAQKQIAILLKWLDARALEEMLDDLPNNEAMQKAMLAAYIAGDEQKMIELSDQERAEWKKFGRTDAEYDQMMNEMLYDRNASWIEPIEKLHAAGGGFIAVGAMHLVGKGSVLDLLQQSGYKVTRLTP